MSARPDARANAAKYVPGHELRSRRHFFYMLGPVERLDHNHVSGRNQQTSRRKKFDNALG